MLGSGLTLTFSTKEASAPWNRAEAFYYARNASTRGANRTGSVDHRCYDLS